MIRSLFTHARGWVQNSLGRARGFLPHITEAVDEIRQERDI